MAAAFMRHPLAEQNRQEIAEFLAKNVITDADELDDLTGRLPAVPHAPREEKESKRRAYIESAHFEHGKHARPESPYTISIVNQIREVMIRRVQILKGGWGTQAIATVSFIFQAIIFGTLFLDVPDATSSYFSRGGVLFL